MSRRFWLQQFGLLAVLAALCLTLTGCGSKVTKENFEKLKVDMTESEVKGIMGEPEITDSPAIPAQAKSEINPQDVPEQKAGKKWQWKSGDATIFLVIVDGKVARAPQQSGLIKSLGSGK